jgi:hypothetical protein
VGELPATLPASCGLALALPMNFAAVESAISGGAYSDYIGRAASLGSAQRIWEHGFHKVAAAATWLVTEAGRLGVIVVTDAALEDIRALFCRCTVVTIVAHWRGPEIASADIRLAPELIIDRLQHEDSRTAGLIRAGLAPEWGTRILLLNGVTARKSRLAELLDRRMRQQPHLVPPPQGVEWHMDSATLRHENRAALDEWWPEAFAPGNRLELADGLHAVQTIASCVPPAWAGIADLSNCQSAQAMDGIKQGRPDRIVIANERETNPLRRMALLCVVYDLLAKRMLNYAEARIALSEAMLARAACGRRA